MSKPRAAIWLWALRWCAVLVFALAPHLSLAHQSEHELLSPDLDCHLCLVSAQMDSADSVAAAAYQLFDTSQAPPRLLTYRPYLALLPRAVARAPPVV